DAPRDGGGGGAQVARRHDLVHEPEGECAAGVAVSPGEQHLVRCLEAHHPRQHEAHDATAVTHLGRAEHAVVRGDGHVAHRADFHRAAETVTVHGGDQRFRAVPETHDALEVACELLSYRARVAVIERR